MEENSPKQRPWISETGKPLDLSTLRELSRAWSAKDWEVYLTSLDGHQRELQASTNTVEELGLAANVYPTFLPGCSPELSKIVVPLLRALTRKQKFVIKKIFFEGRSERQVARMMMISRSGVVDLKKRALRKLKSKARAALSKFPIVRAQDETKERQSEVRESRKKGELSC